MSFRLAAYWTAVLLTAAVASLAAAIPFTGPAASTAGVLASGGVCLIGMACSPDVRKGVRR
jgi:hypothetical protein